jgi:hypothetical protein
MTASEVEQWALKELRRSVLQESDRVEFKSQLTNDLFKLARQIAGHANSARGEWVLWILGVDEELGLVGIPGLEWAKLWPQIESCFDGKPPRPVIVPFEENGKALAAVAFETTLPPYVVNNSGNDRLEVPWREGTRVRSAKHSDLLLLLSQTSSIPEVEVVQIGPLTRTDEVAEADAMYSLSAQLYFIPKSLNRVAIPIHRAKLSLLINDTEPWIEAYNTPSKETTISFFPIQFIVLRETVGTPAICDGYQIILDGPAMIRFNTAISVPKMGHPDIRSATIRLSFSVNLEPLPLELLLRFES